MNTKTTSDPRAIVPEKPGSFSLWQEIVAMFYHPAVLTYLSTTSMINRFKSYANPDVTHWEAPYSGERILLFAMYQKGRVREDAIRMLQAAKAKGLYVVATNTLKLQNPEQYEDLIDCYTERHNFGRDFGSYKQAFSHIYKRGWHDTCSRVLMLNDSVFFSAARMPYFLDQMMADDFDVLGSTENYEINYHLGSFCIAIGSTVLRHPKFQKYWKRFRLSDVRSRVIDRGEMGLSKVLTKCASDPTQMKTLFDSASFARTVRDADALTLDRIISLCRKSTLTPAKRFVLADQLQSIERDYVHDLLSDKDTKLEHGSLEPMIKNKMLLKSYTHLEELVSKQLMDRSNEAGDAVRDAVVSALIDNFRQHSQIHQNAALLVMMGLPIIKLDGLYRGIFNVMDVNLITQQLDETEADELEDLLYARPYGGDVLVGWKRSAFMRGLI